MPDQYDIEYAVLTETIVHPETRAVVAHEGQRFIHALPDLIAVGADCIETSIGTVTIGEEIVQ